MLEGGGKAPHYYILDASTEPQVYFLVDLEGNFLVDYIGNFERLTSISARSVTASGCLQRLAPERTDCCSRYSQTAAKLLGLRYTRTSRLRVFL